MVFDTSPPAGDLESWRRSKPGLKQTAGRMHLRRRFKDESVEDHDLIVMGNINIPKIGDSLFNALNHCGLQVPNALVNLKVELQLSGGTNLGKDARYDQILHLPTVRHASVMMAAHSIFSGTTQASRNCFRMKTIPGRNSAFRSQTTFHFGCKSRPTSTVNDSIRSYKTERRRNQHAGTGNRIKCPLNHVRSGVRISG